MDLLRKRAKSVSPHQRSGDVRDILLFLAFVTRETISRDTYAVK